MLGFRLEKETVISQDILTCIVSFVILFLLAVYCGSRHSLSGADYLNYSWWNIYYMVFGGLAIFIIVYTIVHILYRFYSWLFNAYYIKYYISGDLVGHSDDTLLNMIYTGAIPYIDDESIEELGYKVKYVKVSSKEYESLLRAINHKKCMEEQERMEKVREKYESGRLFRQSKIYLGK